jgi:hypothetical protein
LRQIGTVVALILDELAVLDLLHGLDQLIHEVAVMGNEQDGKIGRASCRERVLVSV